jgi:hypothetical protein
VLFCTDGTVVARREPWFPIIGIDALLDAQPSQGASSPGTSR